MKIALITLYYPNENVIKNIESIIQQVDRVFICDNTPDGNVIIENDIVEYISFNKNYGLSAAFNKVLKDEKNRFKDDDFIFFFDQDSFINLDHVNLLVDEYICLEKEGYDIGCIGPIYYNTSSRLIEEPKIKKMLSNKSYIVKSIITSSMCCRYETLREIDFWNESVFLDMADWDLCWRFLKNKKLCVLSKVVTMEHSLGEGERKILGLFRIRCGAPIREYYQTRDCLYLLKEKYVPIKYKIRFILMVTIRPILHVTFLNQRRTRLRYILQGVSDFLKKKQGCIN